MLNAYQRLTISRAYRQGVWDREIETPLDRYLKEVRRGHCLKETAEPAESMLLLACCPVLLPSLPLPPRSGLSTVSKNVDSVRS